MPFYPVLGESSPTKIDYRKKGTLIGISAPQLLASGRCAPRASLGIHVPVKRPPSSLPCCSTVLFFNVEAPALLGFVGNC